MTTTVTLMLAALLVGCLDEQAQHVEIVGGIADIDKTRIESIHVETTACDTVVVGEQNSCCALDTVEEQHECVALQAPQGACISVVCVAECELTRLHGCNFE